jgi:hypothetical protein
MSKKKATPDSAVRSFGHATRDPESFEVINVGGRLLRTRPFTPHEEASFFRDAHDASQAAERDGRLWLRADEVALAAPYLTKRVADDQGDITGEWLADALSGDELGAFFAEFSRAVGQVYGFDAGDEGKARSAKRRS